MNSEDIAKRLQERRAWLASSENWESPRYAEVAADAKQLERQLNGDEESI